MNIRNTNAATPRGPCVIASVVMVLFACGCTSSSGDGGADEPVSHTVSTNAGANGSISPSSASVGPNGTASFTVTPDVGYLIDSVSGCNGSLTGNTYSTGPVAANCIVSVVFRAATTMAVTDIFVHDHRFGFSDPDYTPIAACNPAYSLAECEHRAHDVNAGIGGDTVSIWMKQEEVEEHSDTAVITDVAVTHWSSNDAWAPNCPDGYEFVSGDNAPAGSALTTGTDSSCKRMGLCVRKAMMRDALIDRPLATMNLSVTTGGIASPTIAGIDGDRVRDGEGYRRASLSRDIHEGCGDGWFFIIAGYKTDPDSALLPKPEMDVVLQPELEPGATRTIVLAENGYPLDYHSIAGFRTEHLQAMIRLPDSNGQEYYMGTFSQDCEGNDCGMVFVGEVPAGGSAGAVIWMDFLNGQHPASGFNHPGDLHRIGDYVIVAGQNWDECWIFNCLDVGGGGQAVLFYDVSDPANPEYVGRMNSCWQGEQIRFHNGDIDTIGVAKIDDNYYLSFNDLRCRADSFHPKAHWEVTAEAGSPSDSPAKFVYGGTTYVGKASVAVGAGIGLPVDGSITWQAYTDDFNTLTDVLSIYRLAYDYDPDAKALSTLPDGTYCAISTDVESDVGMYFRVQCNQ